MNTLNNTKLEEVHGGYGANEHDAEILFLLCRLEDEALLRASLMSSQD